MSFKMLQPITLISKFFMPFLGKKEEGREMESHAEKNRNERYKENSKFYLLNEGKFLIVKTEGNSKSFSSKTFSLPPKLFFFVLF